MFVKQFLIGGDRNFAYIVADEASRQAAVIDPSYNPRKIYEFAGENDFKIKYIFYTHGHYDHTNGNDELVGLTSAPALGYGSVDPVSGEKIQDGARMYLGELEIHIIQTPGHTHDSICIHAGDAVFTGDTLFVGKVGGTDFGQQARAEYESLHNKLMTLPDETRVFPGHNYGIAPESTIAHEHTTNPFLQQPDFEAFVRLKKNWLQYKKEHGIT